MMLMRCAGRAMTGMAVMAGLTGLAVAGGTLAVAYVAKRMWDERSAWRDTSAAPAMATPAPMEEPGPDAPAA